MNKFDKSRYSQLKMFETKNKTKKDAFQEKIKTIKNREICTASHKEKTFQSVANILSPMSF